MVQKFHILFKIKSKYQAPHLDQHGAPASALETRAPEGSVKGPGKDGQHTESAPAPSFLHHWPTLHINQKASQPLGL